MSYFEGYSPDFQDAYERRIKEKVIDEPTFNDWVNEFDKWINRGTTMKDYKPPSKSQVKALAYNAEKEGIENISVEERVKDSRVKTGKRTIYRDVKTGKFAKNPYKESEE